MNVEETDTLFAALLVSGTCARDDLAAFIRTGYGDYCGRVARSIIERQYPAMHNPLLVAEAAAEKVIESQVVHALRGTFKFNGNSRYSTYLYTAISRQVPRIYHGMVVHTDGGRRKKPRIEVSQPRNDASAAAETSTQTDAVEARVYRTLVLEGLGACVARLEPLEASLVTLVYLRGYTPTAACRQLGLRSPSYTWKLVQARLRTMLERNDLPSLYAAWQESAE